MLAREILLAERRRALITQADALRAESATLLGGFEPLFGAADTATSVAGWARRHAPLIAGVMLLTLALRRPKRIMGLATRAWSIWQLYQDLRGRLDSLVKRPNKLGR